MGQYKLRQRLALNKKLWKQHLEELITQLANFLRDRTEINLQQLREKLNINGRIEDTLLIKIIKTIKPNIIIRSTLYHWYDEPNYAKLLIKMEPLKKIIYNLMDEFGIKYPYRFFRKVLKLSETQAIKYIKWLRSEEKELSVAALKEFCRIFKVKFDDLEKLNLFIDRKFPIPLDSPTIAKIKTHILNEGLITQDKPGRERIAYINKDPVLHRYFRKLLFEIGYTCKSPPLPRERSLRSNAPATLARALHKAGLPYGKKTITNPSLDPQVYTNPEVRKYHFQATLTEEGCSSLFISKNRLRMQIAWKRGIDITDKLTPTQIDKIKKLAKNGEISLTKIEDAKIKRVVLQNPPIALIQEAKLLAHVHKDKIDVSKWPRPHPSVIKISKEGRITVTWIWTTGRMDLIDLMYNEYGMLPGTSKSEIFKKFYELFIQYRGKLLSEDESKMLRGLIKQVRLEYSEEWLKNKLKELFPNADWIKDERKVRRWLKSET